MLILSGHGERHEGLLETQDSLEENCLNMYRPEAGVHNKVVIVGGIVGLQTDLLRRTIGEQIIEERS